MRSSSVKADFSLAEPGWKIARTALNYILHYSCGKNVRYHIDWVKKVGEGLSKEVYRADVTVFQQEEQQLVLAVSLLLHDADEDASSGMVHEFHVLDRLNQAESSFSVPEPVGILWHKGTLVSVRTFACGLPLELRTSKTHHGRPWEVIAKLAAEIHRFPRYALPLSRNDYSTRQDHALASLAPYDHSHIPEIRDAVQWVRAHLPPHDDATFLHGDLLGQNVYRTLHESVWVLDWEYACYGDPAYDLAIVTRGAKKPFQISGGLEYFIDSYRAAGGKAVTQHDVHMYEILLLLGWYAQSLNRSGGGHAPEHYLQRLQGLLKRIR